MQNCEHTRCVRGNKNCIYLIILIPDCELKINFLDLILIAAFCAFQKRNYVHRNYDDRLCSLHEVRMEKLELRLSLPFICTSISFYRTELHQS